MPYLVDGHNLIPKLGLRLDSPDDEMELVAILRDFARLKRQPVEVYFDGAPIGHSGTRSLGTIRAHFVRLGQTADNAISARLNKLGKSARNWIVVSSDREVQNAARVNQAQHISSEEFVKILKEERSSASKVMTSDKKISAQEVEDWLKLFNDKQN
ncbi:MAG TPA: NYN domain-containing protein [Anaerolineales bacterium]|nr:NYN domain-containing protein [Anaerolineales bacterium]